MITTVNPATEEILANYEELTSEQIEEKLRQSIEAFESWKKTSLAERSSLMKKLAKLIRERKNDYGKLITSEMGKVFKQSLGELDKCAFTAELYAEDLENMLAPQNVKTEGSESYVTFEPIGPVLAIMPWNFPFWQALRFAIPNILAGNVGVLKHSSMVQGCARELEDLFLDAGFPEGVFQNLCISSSQVEGLIRDSRIKAVTLTGSNAVGSKVASIAGECLKKTVMELGGSDPYIVLADADIDLAAKIGVQARLRNAGQTCTSAKRFIVVKEIAEEFTNKFLDYWNLIKVGDPMDTSIDMGPLASAKILGEVKKQVSDSELKGARIVAGGKSIDGKGFYFEPTVLVGVTKGMPAYDEEVFGPVAAIIVAEDTDHAIEIANDSIYGLGSSLWTRSLETAKSLVPRIEAGSVYVNNMLASDPRLPFGGVKQSGYGRELSALGIKEFMNIKAIWIK